MFSYVTQYGNSLIRTAVLEVKREGTEVLTKSCADRVIENATVVYRYAKEDQEEFDEFYCPGENMATLWDLYTRGRIEIDGDLLYISIEHNELGDFIAVFSTDLRGTSAEIVEALEKAR